MVAKNQTKFTKLVPKIRSNKVNFISKTISNLRNHLRFHLDIATIVFNLQLIAFPWWQRHRWVVVAAIVATWLLSPSSLLWSSSCSVSYWSSSLALRSSSLCCRSWVTNKFCYYFFVFYILIFILISGFEKKIYNCWWLYVNECINMNFISNLL